MRPLFDLAVAEHEFLMIESGARSYLRKTGWLILYRSEGTFAATSSERDLASEFGIPYRVLDVELLEIFSLLSRRYFATWSTGKVSPVFFKSACRNTRLCGSLCGAWRHCAPR